MTRISFSSFASPRPNRHSRWAVFTVLAGLAWNLSCGQPVATEPDHCLPDAALARQAIERSLQRWQDAPQELVSSRPIDSVLFVDQQRQPAQRLRQFTILSTSQTASYHRFLVRLTLDQPEEVVTAAYHVFGKDPIWVYRSEDLDMIMHWECPMEASPGAAASTQAKQAGPEARPPQAPGTQTR